ncbi:hypothetical protein [Azospirillum doebereinerae]
MSVATRANPFTSLVGISACCDNARTGHAGDPEIDARRAEMDRLELGVAIGDVQPRDGAEGR